MWTPAKSHLSSRRKGRKYPCVHPCPRFYFILFFFLFFLIYPNNYIHDPKFFFLQMKIILDWQFLGYESLLKIILTILLRIDIGLRVRIISLYVVSGFVLKNYFSWNGGFVESENYFRYSFEFLWTVWIALKNCFSRVDTGSRVKIILGIYF